MSVATGGAQANAPSFAGVVSKDGRFVAFTSSASNLVAGETNNVNDVFVHDLQTGTIERVSIASDGGEANGRSEVPDISADGRYVAFWSTASNLVADDTNLVPDAFVHDRVTHVTERVSLDGSGTQANGETYGPAISGDGRFVAFCSDATNLVAGDGNATTDMFIRDRQLGITVRASLSSSGAEGNGRSCQNSAGDISTDGRFVTYPSLATNLVSDDTNALNDVFVRDLVLNTTERVSISSAGVEGNGLSAWPFLDDDGRYVVYSSLSNNLVPSDGNGTWDVFLRDRQAGTTERVTVGPGGEANLNSGYASVSDDGRFVAYFSYATNLVANDTNGIGDIFVLDRASGTTERASVDSDGNQASGPNLEVDHVAISADGSRVSYFFSDAGLVSGDTNGASDVFLRDRASTPPPGPPAPPATCGASDDLRCEVLVSWSASAGATGYRVLRDGTQVADVATTSYSDAVSPGGFTYCVTAYNADGESSATCDGGTALVPPTYDPASGHYYEVVAGRLPSWTAARDSAAAHRLRGAGGHLVSITSPEEQAFVRTVPGGAIGLFLGGYQLSGSPEPGGGWVWVTGEGFSYQNWAPGEPNNASGQGAEGFLIWQDDQARWNDVREDNTNEGYLVEYEPPFLLPAPANPQATDGTSCTVSVTWDAVPGATGYRLYRDGALLAPLPAGSTAYDDAAAPPYRHIYCVEAFNACGGSARACETGSATAPPPTISASDNMRCAVDVSWTPIATAAGYFVYRDGQLLTSVGAATTAITDTLMPGSYQYAVSSVNPCGLSERGLDSGVSQVAPPFEPVGGNYYELIVQPGTWDEARGAAAAQRLIGVQGHLATLTSYDENSFVSSLVGGRDTWIGGFQAEGFPEPGEGWRWVTTEPWGFTQWLPGEPNQLAGEEDCLRFKTLLDGFRGWNDERCFLPSEAFVVEYDHRTPLSGPASARASDGLYTHVDVEWAPAAGSNVFGYRVYRDATLLVQLSPGQLTFRDTPILGTYLYCVRSINRCGAESLPVCDWGNAVEPPPPPPPPGGRQPPESHEPCLTDEVIPAPNPGREFTLRLAFVHGGWVRISVHDVAGREVARVADRYFPPGASRVQWDGRRAGGQRAEPGLYLVRMRIGSTERVQRVVLLQ